MLRMTSAVNGHHLLHTVMLTGAAAAHSLQLYTLHAVQIVRVTAVHWRSAVSEWLFEPTRFSPGADFAADFSICSKVKFGTGVLKAAWQVNVGQIFAGNSMMH